MLWLGIGLTLLFVAGWILYSRRKDTMTLARDQEETVSKVVRKEIAKLAEKTREMVERAASKGESVSLDEAFSDTGNLPDHTKSELELIKKESFYRYGPKIPNHVFERVINQLDPDEESPWSDNPGCFERHLQRREGNLLFPPERRMVTQKEIDEATERDRLEQQAFAEKFYAFLAKTVAPKNTDLPPCDALSLLTELGKLLAEAASIGGEDIAQFMQILQSTEDKLKQSWIEAVPDGTDDMNSITNLSAMDRIYYFAQALRKDSPILKEEEIPALLSEDLGVISLAGYVSRAFAPNYRPNETDIRSHLEKAVIDGFSEERAAQILSAWNET